MKRAHRQGHLIIWLLVAPVTLTMAVLFLTKPKPDPFTEIPAELAEEAP